MQTAINNELRKQQMNLNLDVDILRGGTLESISEKGQQILGNSRYDACYVFAGVNNLTTSFSKRYSIMNYHDIPTMVDDMMDRLEKTRADLQKCSRSTVICHLIGINLAAYNKLETTPCKMNKKTLTKQCTILTMQLMP